MTTGARNGSRKTLCGLCLLPFAAAMFQNPGPTAEQDYRTGRGTDPVTELQGKIESGALKLAYEPRQGFLRSLLRELKISPTSQILVFSKTSLQTPYISPTSPRAIYFNDQVYVGWIRNAPNIEIASIDPQRGPIFYTLRNEIQPKPTFNRENDECLQCHEGTMTKHVPGLAFRSVFTGIDGLPRLANGSFITGYKSPLKERWGGWYVTGTHGPQRHMGNEVATGDERNSKIDIEKGANVTDLRSYFPVSAYLTSSSDIVALMVAEHQMDVQNLLTKAGFQTRNALRDEVIFAPKGLRPGEHSVSTQERIQHACEPLIQAMLCIDEFKLTSPLAGTTAFASEYALSAPEDKQGRSLSQLDLKTRLLRYRCSPLIYSPAFDGLPPEAKNQIYRRLNEILSGADTSHPYDQLESRDRRAIFEILKDTKTDFASMIDAP